MLKSVLLLVSALSAISLVVVILLQRSESAVGGAFGGGGTGEVPSSARNPLVKITSILAVIFMGSALLLAVVTKGSGTSSSVFDDVQTPAEAAEALGGAAPLPGADEIPAPPSPIGTQE